MSEWIPPADLAGLPDMPGSVRAVNMRGDRGELTRRKRTEGKGWEYLVTDLPAATQAALLAKRKSSANPSEPAERKTVVAYDSEAIWAFAAKRPQNLQDEGVRRAQILDQVMALVYRGQNFRHAAQLIAAQYDDVTRGTIRNWYYGSANRPEQGARHYARHDWPAVLIPKWTGSQAQPAECTPEAWDAFKADYLRPERPSANACYRRLERMANVHGWTIPVVKTLLRRLESEVGAPAICLAREGQEAMIRRYPAQERDRSVFHALEGVNADGHKFDDFVIFPDGEEHRPMLTAWQDLFSGRIVGWRISKTENADSYRLSFADVLRTFGCPKAVWLDNGRGIASKIMTGGTPNRYRFKVTAEEPIGLITQVVGSEGIHWTTPYHGQAKPIERAFRDMCDDIAKDPRLAGAWTGNTPLNKPENYHSKPAPFDVFMRVVQEGINEHNARTGRRSTVCQGRSFNEAFDASYKANAHLIAQPTQAQLRRFLLAAQQITAAKVDGSVSLLGNRFWCEALGSLAERPLAQRKVIVHFDPDNLSAGVHISRTNGIEIGFAECIQATGFNDTEAAREHGRNRKAYERATKEQLAAQRRMDVGTLGRLLDDASVDQPEPEPPQSKVVAGVFKPAKRVAGSDVVPEQEQEGEELRESADLYIQQMQENWRKNRI